MPWLSFESGMNRSAAEVVKSYARAGAAIRVWCPSGKSRRTCKGKASVRVGVLVLPEVSNDLGSTGDRDGMRWGDGEP